MDRFSILLTLPVGAVATGAFTILAFNLGFYAWPAVIGAAVLGFGLSWPLAYVISRRVKRQDPNWDETRVERTGTVPNPAAREV
ncbi:hypothetical protein N0B44_14705 [Roseibacterium beibuensis]|uniref:Uncharacterized protein n=1 Tax=[Roseibacterium] beibuensis TaxID=1193142 RepID=A0ABP9L7C8_9RHOB|nr:hypothetical protein [Roseibacterium beibuensis]MCS6624166.1 hypothetical protein [Roseibacterium beibuensis]